MDNFIYLLSKQYKTIHPIFFETSHEILQAFPWCISTLDWGKSLVISFAGLVNLCGRIHSVTLKTVSNNRKP